LRSNDTVLECIGELPEARRTQSDESGQATRGRDPVCVEARARSEAPPSLEQIERIAAALDMGEADVASLLEAARDSQKKLRLPDDLHSDTLRVINRLVRASTRLNGDQVTLLDELVARLDR